VEKSGRLGSLSLLFSPCLGLMSSLGIFKNCCISVIHINGNGFSSVERIIIASP